MRALAALIAPLLLIAVAATTAGTLGAFSQATQTEGSTFATASSFFTCPATPSSSTYLTGWEMGRRPYHGTSMVLITPATGSVDSAVKRSGGYSLKLNPAAAQSYAYWTGTGGLTSQVARFALYLDALPTQNVSQLASMNSAGGLDLRYVAATKKLAVAIRSTAAGTPVVVNSDLPVQAGTWYVIDVRYRVASPTHIADWRINGSPQPSASVAGAGSATNQLQLGTMATTDTFTAHYDDVIMSSTSGDYPFGDGRVEAIRPDGPGTSVGAAGVISTDSGALDASSWQKLTEVPMSATTAFVQQTAAVPTAYAEFTLQNTTASCVRGARGYYTTHSPALNNKSNHVKVVVVDGTQQSTVFEGSTIANNTTSRDASGHVAPATTWSPAALNGLVVRFGFSNNVSNAFPVMDSVMVEYEVPQ